MTDLIARPVEDQRQHEPDTGTRTATKGAIIVLALLLGAVAGWALYVNAGPSRAALEEAHWEATVEYYTSQYQVMAEARAQAESAYWAEVMNHYARQYELMSNSTRAGAVDGESAHWEAVVDYYEQQWKSGRK